MAIRQQLERAGRQEHWSARAGHQGTSRYQPAVLTADELLDLLNDDFARECQGVYAYAVYAEKYRDTDPEAAAECEARGQREVAHAMTLCQLVYDFGGAVTAAVDDRAAVRRAARVARPGWRTETVRRLRERAEQLRSAGRPHLANRLLVLIDHKEAADDLPAILRRHPDPVGR